MTVLHVNSLDFESWKIRLFIMNILTLRSRLVFCMRSCIQLNTNNLFSTRTEWFILCFQFLNWTVNHFHQYWCAGTWLSNIEYQRIVNIFVYDVLGFPINLSKIDFTDVISKEQDELTAIRLFFYLKSLIIRCILFSIMFILLFLLSKTNQRGATEGLSLFFSLSCAKLP